MVNCPICLENFDTTNERVPRTMQCGHTLCLGCIQKLSKNNNQALIQCPVDRLLVPVPTSNNFALLETIETDNRRIKLMGQVVCSGCSAEKAAVYCVECQVDMCASCQHQYHASKLFEKHSVISAEERKLFKDREKCGEHGERKLLICLECNDLVCLLCKDYGVHQHHRLDLISKIAVSFGLKLEEFFRLFHCEKYKEGKLKGKQMTDLLCSIKLDELEENLKDLDKAMDELKETEGGLREALQSLASAKEKSKTLVMKELELVREAIRNKEIEALSMLDDFIAKNSTKASAKVMELESIVEETNHLREEYKSLKTSLQGVDLLIAIRKIHERTTLLTNSCKSALDFEPIATNPPLCFNTPEILKALKVMGKITDLKHPQFENEFNESVKLRYLDIKWKSVPNAVKYELQMRHAPVEEQKSEDSYNVLYTGDQLRHIIQIEHLNTEYCLRVRCFDASGIFSTWSLLTFHSDSSLVEVLSFNASAKAAEIELSNSNMTARMSQTRDYCYVVGNIGFSCGIHYWKVRIDSVGRYIALGVSDHALTSFNGSYNGHGIWNVFSNGEEYLAITNNRASRGGFAYDTGDIILIKLDCDQHKMCLTKLNSDSFISCHVANGLLYPIFNLSGSAAITLLPPSNEEVAVIESIAVSSS